MPKERCLDADHAAHIEALTEDRHIRQYSRGQQAAVQLIGISVWYINRKSALVHLGTKTFSKVGPQLRYLSILPCPQKCVHHTCDLQNKSELVVLAGCPQIHPVDVLTVAHHFATGKTDCPAALIRERMRTSHYLLQMIARSACCAMRSGNW